MVMHTRVIGASPLAPQMIAGMEQGWGESFDKLAAMF
jgi:hypothetical protein